MRLCAIGQRLEQARGLARRAHAWPDRVVVCSHQTVRVLPRAASACSMASTGVTPMPADSRTTGVVVLAEDELASRRRDVEVVADGQRGCRRSRSPGRELSRLTLIR